MWLFFFQNFIIDYDQLPSLGYIWHECHDVDSAFGLDKFALFFLSVHLPEVQNNLTWSPAQLNNFQEVW